MHVGVKEPRKAKARCLALGKKPANQSFLSQVNRVPCFLAGRRPEPAPLPGGSTVTGISP